MLDFQIPVKHTRKTGRLFNSNSFTMAEIYALQGPCPISFVATLDALQVDCVVCRPKNEFIAEELV